MLTITNLIQMKLIQAETIQNQIQNNAELIGSSIFGNFFEKHNFRNLNIPLTREFVTYIVDTLQNSDQTVVNISAKIGVSAPVVNKIRNGFINNLQLSTLLVMCQEFDFDFEKAVDWNEIPVKSHFVLPKYSSNHIFMQSIIGLREINPQIYYNLKPSYKTWGLLQAHIKKYGLSINEQGHIDKSISESIKDYL